MRMEALKKTNLMHLLLFILALHSCPSLAQPATKSYCGKIEIQRPFSIQNSSSPLSQILLCKSEKLYFRTTLGLFQVSSIDYRAKTFTIPHTSCSSSIHFISPTLLSAGFPTSPQPNSLLLFNCLSQKEPMSPFLHNCTSFYGCKALLEKQEQTSTCWIVHDSDKLEKGFNPKDLKCTHYRRIYRDSSSPTSFSEGFKLGTVVSFDVPDHVPNVCDECSKAEGNCGAGLRCICHPKECRDKVISGGAPTRSTGDTIVYLPIFSVVIISLISLGW